jgi:acetyl-CoA synthetase
MSDHASTTVYQPTEGNASRSILGGSLEKRQAMYNESVQDNEQFWARIAQQFQWEKKWDQVLSYNYHKDNGPIFQKWFEGGLTNVCYTAVDRWLDEHKDQVAFYFEGNDLGEASQMTFAELHKEVTQLAGVLKDVYGIQKGDRVSVYLPMITFGPVAMLACARIGAMVSVVFGGFSAASLAARLLDSQSKLLITAEGTLRGDKPIKLKHIADDALAQCEAEGLSCRCIVYERHGRAGVPMKEGRDVWYGDVVEKAQPYTGIEWVEAEHPLFMLYTSGSTGKPKGLVHTTGGYMVYAATTFKYVFDYQPGDVYFCTADIGWITGHTYVVYGPLLNRATSLIYEGLPTHPSGSRWWALVDKYKVSQFYTAPTAIRALMKLGEEPVKQTARSSLRVLASVGEPINVAAWEWYYHLVGNEKCDLVDTWWQTETGGIMITPIPGTTPLKPSSATLPFFGIQPAVLDSQTNAELEGTAEGLLCIKRPWPGQARTIYKDHERYEQTYFAINGFYFSGDGCRRDSDGYYWLTGRVDDVLNVSGHRLGTSEIENAINSNPHVVESAVVGVPHDIKGEGIYAYVTFKPEVEVTAEVLNSVKITCRERIGAIATPDAVQPAPGLPKTRSGKIMRRILRKIAANIYDELGDISTLADPGVVTELIAMREKYVLKKK